MSQAELQWLEIRDWTPGIRQRSQNDPGFRTAGVSAPVYGLVSNQPGIGAVDGTYRCIALPEGGIGPLPREGSGFARTGSPLPANTTATVTGFGLMGPSYVQSGVTDDIRPYFTEAAPRNNTFIVGYHYDSGSNRITNVERWFPSALTYPTFDSIDTHTSANYAGTPANPVWTAYGRSHPNFGGTGTATDAGPPITVISYSNPSGGVISFPDPLSPTTNSIYRIFGVAAGGGMVVAHQSRFVILTDTAWGLGAANNYSVTNEDISYTQPNDVRATPSVFAANFSPEDPVGVGAVGSLSSSDLLLIKHQFGAYLIQGALESPMVRRLPGVMSTNGAETKGALTPIGFVYGVNGGGVYVWNGGDSSTNLAPQLDPSFWQLQPLPGDLYSGGTLFRSFQGHFSAWGEWVMAPNNWLYDTNTNSWWRLQDPAVHQYWMYQPDILHPFLYACGPTFTNSTSTFIYDYDKTQGATNWHWQSQPIVLGNYRRVDIKDIILVFQSQSSTGGTIIVTLSDDAGATYTKTITYAHNGGRVQVARFTVSPTYSNDAYFRVFLNADGGANSAPIVNLIRFGYEDTHEMARS